jgi:hypothetical protein
MLSVKSELPIKPTDLEITSTRRCHISYSPEELSFWHFSFKVPIQAIKAVNELVRTLAAVRARLDLPQTSADLVEDVE